ncbi:MAG: helix-turn-helix domain-containing protein [Clostridium sp.]
MRRPAFSRLSSFKSGTGTGRRAWEKNTPRKEVPHNLKLYLKQQEDAIIQEALDKFNGRKEKAAQYLGISDRTLRYKLSNMGKTGKDNDSEELE